MHVVGTMFFVVFVYGRFLVFFVVFLVIFVLFSSLNRLQLLRTVLGTKYVGFLCLVFLQ